MDNDKFEQLFKKVENLHDLFKEIELLNQTQQTNITHLEHEILQQKQTISQTEKVLHETEKISNNIHKKHIIKNITLAGFTGFALDCIVPFSSSICYGLGVVGICGYEWYFKIPNLNKNNT